jgi:hypothetical protein
LTETGSDGEHIVDNPIERLAMLMIREAVQLHCHEIQLDVVDNACPMHYLRGDERLERDTLPQRLFAPLRDHLARVCGQPIGAEPQTFLTSVRTTDTASERPLQVEVSVTGSENGLRLTIRSA